MASLGSSIRRLIGAGLLAGTTLLSTSAPAVLPPTPQKAIPGVASTNGPNGSHWQSDLYLTNHSDHAANATICYVSSDRQTEARECKQVSVPSKHTAFWDDIVKDFFNAQYTFGMLTFSSDVDPSLIELRSQTYHKDMLTGATLGVGIDPVQTLAKGDSAVFFAPSDVVKSRANFAHFTTNASAKLRVTLKDAAGSDLESIVETLGPYRILQDPLFNGTFRAQAFPGATVQVDVLDGGGVIAYLTEVDNITQAPTYQGPFRASDAKKELFTIGAYALGAFGSDWASEVRVKNLSRTNGLSNASTASSTLHVDYLKADRDNTVPTASKDDLFQPDESKSYRNIIGTLLAQEKGTSGGLRFTSEEPFVLTSMTVSSRSDGGTFGVAIPALSIDDAAKAAAGSDAVRYAASISGLNDNENTSQGNLERTNVMVQNVTNQPIDGRIIVFDKNGIEVGSPYDLHLASYEETQINRLLRDRAGGDIMNARIMLELYDVPNGQTTSPRALLYATDVNNKSSHSVARKGYLLPVGALYSLSDIVGAESGTTSVYATQKYSNQTSSKQNYSNENYSDKNYSDKNYSDKNYSADDQSNQQYADNHSDNNCSTKNYRTQKYSAQK